MSEYDVLRLGAIPGLRCGGQDLMVLRRGKITRQTLLRTDVPFGGRAPILALRWLFKKKC